MASSTGQITQNGAAQLLPDGGAGPAQGIQSTVLITAPAAADTYFGYTSGVLTTTGARVAAGSSVSVALAPTERLWCIGPSGVVTWARSQW